MSDATHLRAALAEMAGFVASTERTLSTLRARGLLPVEREAVQSLPPRELAALAELERVAPLLSRALFDAMDAWHRDVLRRSIVQHPERYA